MNSSGKAATSEESKFLRTSKDLSCVPQVADYGKPLLKQLPWLASFVPPPAMQLLLATPCQLPSVVRIVGPCKGCPEEFHMVIIVLSYIIG